MKEPWENEPDYLSWDYKEVHCCIIRNYLGALCGYVGVNKDHPLYGSKYSNFDVHGGITFFGNGIEGMKPDYWYFGFDCCHAGDLLPYYSSVLLEHINKVMKSEYRDIRYVKEHVMRMAKKLAHYEFIAEELLNNV